MVNNAHRGLGPTTRLVQLYVLACLGTVAALVVLSDVRPQAATDEAWGHAVLVAVFAGLLSLRLRAARRGDATAVRRIVVIATVLLAVNVCEAALPGTFPTWMRIEMVGFAALLLAIIVSTAPARAAGRAA